MPLWGLTEGLNIKSSILEGTRKERERCYEEHQTDAEFVSAAKFKRASLELGDTTILHPTAGDTITAFVFLCQVTEKLLPSALCASEWSLGQLSNVGKSRSDFRGLMYSTKGQQRLLSYKLTNRLICLVYFFGLLFVSTFFYPGPWWWERSYLGTRW